MGVVGAKSPPIKGAWGQSPSLAKMEVLSFPLKTLGSPIPLQIVGDRKL